MAKFEKPYVLYTRRDEGETKIYVYHKGRNEENPQDIHPNPWIHRGEFETEEDLWSFVIDAKI